MRLAFIIIFISAFLNVFSQAPSNFNFTTTPSYGTFLGTVQIDGFNADSEDWIAAFDETGVCAGASQISFYENQSKIVLTIYGDDATTTIDDGMSNNESFTLILFDSSENQYYTYQSTQNTVFFENWQNTNGGLIPGYDDLEQTYNFIVSSGVSLSLTDTIYCSNETSFDFEGGMPEGGSYYIENELADLLLSSQNIFPGFYEVVYVFEDQSASQNIYIVSTPVINITQSNESVTVSFDPVLNVDQYKFRYREQGTSLWNEVTIGAIDGVETSESSVTIADLTVCTDYEIQTKLYATDQCETDWSGSTFFSLDYFLSTSISGCDSLLVEGEYKYESGIYTYEYQGVNQCDSILEYNININNSYNNPTEVVTSCDSYFWNGEVYNQSGVYFVNNPTSSGCDSTATLALTIFNSSSNTETVAACESYFWNGQLYTQSGVYSFISINTNGCDSITTLDLTIYNATTSTENVVACDEYFWNGQLYFQSGTYTFNGTNSLGCDSVATLNLTISNSSTVSEIDTTCDSYFWNGETYTSSGIYSYETTNSAGCDSTVYLILTLNNSYNSIETVSTCESYPWKGQLYTQSGVYTSQLFNNVGCDSVSTLNLTINEATSSFEEVVSCFNFEWNNQTYSESGTYTYETVNSNGCDSVATLSLTIINSNSTTESFTSCEAFTWNNGITYTESNDSDFYIVYGPDSLCGDTFFLNLTILNPTFGNDNQVHCESYTWIDGVTYTESNNSATFTLTNSVGCDSIVTLDLTILEPTNSTDTQTHCESYTWIDGVTYTESNNSATFVLTNSAGCDSLVTLDLTILNATNGTDSQAHCDSYTWIDGITYTESNNDATYTLINSAGCDSVVTLDLTILNATSGTDTQTHCDSYTWIDGITYTESNNSATYTLINSVGCDSIVTIDLSIINSTNSTDNQTHCNSYTWIDGITYTESNNTATQVFTNSEGCDSLIVLNLTIVDTSLVIDSQIHCDSYTWTDGFTYTTSNNTATQVFSNSAGCDSTILLDLTILDSYVETDTQIQCDSFTWIDGNTYTESNNTAVFVSNYLDKWNVANGDTTNWLPFGANLISNDNDAVKITGNGSSSLGARIFLNETNLIESLELNKNYVLSAKIKTSDAVNVSVNDGVSPNSASAILVTSSEYVSISVPFVAFSETSAYLYLSSFSNNEMAHIKDISLVEVDESGQVFACDTTILLDLTIINSVITTDTQVHCDSYTWIDGITYNESNNTATQVLTNSVGCDSIVTLDLTILNSFIETDIQVHCDSFTWIDGITYTESNASATFVSNHLEKWNTPSGDASNWLAFGTNIITEENDAVKITGDGSSSLGARVIFNQNNLAESLVLNSNYILTAKVKTSNAVNVSVNDGISSNSASSILVTSSDYVSISFPFVAYSETNAYLYLSSFSNNETAHVKDISIVEVDVNGQIISCDTTIILDLTIINSTTGTDTQVHCNEYTWMDGVTYTESNNTATHVLTNSVGCDSIVTLDLTILNATSGIDNQTHCDSYTWIDGITYTQSNDSANFVLTNSVGCDSIVTLDLTILNATSGTDTQTHCDSYTWIDGITYTESNNSATFLLTNNAGCDSLVTLDLTILNATSGTDTQTHCDSYTWIDGITYTESNNTATYVLSNSLGCDSIVTLNLSILNASAGVEVDNQLHCYNYTWVDGNVYNSSNNTATYTYTNSVGCDSVVTLNLIISESSNSVDTQVHCDSFTWLDGITYTESNNSATFISYQHEKWNLANGDTSQWLTFDSSTNEITQDGDAVKIIGDGSSIFGGRILLNENTLIENLTLGQNYLLTAKVKTSSSVGLTVNDGLNTNSDLAVVVESTDYTLINFPFVAYSETSAFLYLTMFSENETAHIKDISIIEVDENGTFISCDSVITLDLTILNATSGTDTQIHCDSYTWIDGITYTQSNDSATFILTNSVGCDSVVTLELTILNATSGTDTQIHCDSYTWIDGITYTQSNDSATFILTNSVGCDSVVTLELTILNATTGTDTQTHCDSYTWIDGITYTQSNDSATFVLTNSAGCDSIATLDLTILNATIGTDSQIHCDSYTWIDGITYTESNDSATHVLTNGVGCDSVVTLELTILNSTTGTDTQTHCDSYTWIDGITYTESNDSATFVLANSVGCDSVVTLDLTILNATSGTDTQTHCDSYIWIDGITYTESNDSATFNLTNSVGCDSIVTLDLTILNSTTSIDIISQSHCYDYTWIDGITYTESNNTATFTLTNSVGCDSVVTLNLNISDSNFEVDTQVHCDSFTWIDGNTYTESTDSVFATTYFHEKWNLANGDTSQWLTFDSSTNEITQEGDAVKIIGDGSSIFGGRILLNENSLISNLTLNQHYLLSARVKTSSSIALTVNDGNESNIEQAVIVESTEYTTINFPFVANSESNAFLYLALFSANETAHIKDISLIEVNESGEELSCDTVVNLNLTILNATNDTDIQTHCESYTWIDGITYTESNDSATFVLTNSVGCDSIVTLDLTILNATNDTDIQTHCESYTWIDGITYTESNDSATFVLTNSAGCDSLVTLDLTILNATNDTDIQTHCESYTWIDGITYTESNDSATFVLTNSVGCDSIVTLDLTILNATNDTDIQTHCESYTWIDGITYTESNDSATFVLTNSAGCDSLVTLDLTILDATNDTDIQTHCESYTWIDGITYTESNDSATHVLTNSVGCDSLVTLYLTILNATSGTDTLTYCNSYTWIDGITYTESNDSATYALTNSAGCDSIVTLNLTINSSDTVTLIESACDSFDWQGETYTESGVYEHSDLTINGCDSIVYLDLTINYSDISFNDVTACNSYEWNGEVYTESGEYTHNTTTVNGCDSMAILNLTISNMMIEHETTNYSGYGVNCFGDSNGNIEISVTGGIEPYQYQWSDGSDTQNINDLVSGSYTVFVTDSNNCEDSLIVELNQPEPVIISNTVSEYNGFEISCNGGSDGFIDAFVVGGVEPYTYLWSNDSVNASIDSLVSGSYKVIVTDSNNCEASLTVELNQPEQINISYTVSEYNGFEISCNGGSDGFIDASVEGGAGSFLYQWSDGSTDAVNDSLSSGTYFITVIDENECEATSSIELLEPDFIVTHDTVSSCLSYEWNGVVYTQSGDYEYSTTSVEGCDSLAMLSLTINVNDTTSSSISSCVLYTWNDTTYFASGSYSYTYSNVNGCDSVHTIHLTINESSSGTDVQEACEQYTWIDGNTYTSSNNIASFTLTNVVGCDSVVTLDLTIYEPTSSNTEVTACESYVWNGLTYNSSGLYSAYFINSFGCDSIAYLDLTIPEFVPFQIVGPNNVAGGSSANYSLNTNLYDLQWSINDYGEILSGQGSQAIFVEWDNVNANAEICVYGIDEFNCESDLSCVNVEIDRVSSVQEIEFSGISIYPNPFTTKTLIDFSACKQEVTTLELYDTHGKLVYSASVKNKKQFELINDNLNDNMYLLRLYGPNHNSYHKLLTQ